MPLVLPSENELGISSTFTNGNEGEDMDDSIGKGKGKRLERTSSFYPGRGDHSHALARLDPALSTFHTPDVDDDGSLTEDDPVEDDHAVELALKFPNKFSESLAVERPSWPSSGGSEPANTASQSSTTSAASLPNSQKALRLDCQMWMRRRSFPKPLKPFGRSTPI
ncbi:hypothetical protein EI94DRAFT_909378 [Lactarius quietus]|nr:hypothetical protein EI94DRAFT_909378 [Lactarius quietus]